MNNDALKSDVCKTVAGHFPAQYGPRADKWLIDGVLPLIGVGVVEARTLEAAAAVADDMGSRIVQGHRWGGRAALQGPAISYDVHGAGKFIDDPDYTDGMEPLPPLNLATLAAAELPPAELYGFADGIARRGGVRLLVLQLTDELARNPTIPVAAGILARELRCCVLLVTTWPTRELREDADAVLQVAAPATGATPGQIEQPKPPRGREPAVWVYTVTTWDEGTAGEFATVGEVFEVPSHAN